ncbi:hypothetical protein WJX73_005945 [Symbiochloris irregularis]|uniref:FAD-binding FR-type domain-containing protein n=1 Tax=Symbiochloris irregularis TaxID=706552 RepID=A0AAW1Q1F3_9CHLO
MALLCVRQPPQRLRSSLQHACFARNSICTSSLVPAVGQPARLVFSAHDSIFGQPLWRPQSRSARRCSWAAQAAWGDDIEWKKAKISESTLAATGIQKVILDIGSGADSHTKPGQFVQVKVDGGKPGFYAIASPPDSNNQGVIELLVKNQGETAEALCSKSSGAEVEASPVMGKGFQVDKAPADKFPTVVIFATGTGISPIRSLIEADTLDVKHRKDVRLYYGTFSDDKTAYLDQVPSWEAQGISVKHVYSDNGQGYVQDAFEKDGLTDGSQACAVLVGQKEMCMAVTDLLVSKGVDKDKILLNF